MAFLHLSFFSQVLNMNTTVNVILPEVSAECTGADGYQVLYLLHGYSGNSDDWMRFTAVERYAQEHGLAVVMPSAGNSFYCNTASGDRYWDYIAEELPHVMQAYFPFSVKRERNLVAGLSMGGYGAFKLALLHPERFSLAISFSGVVDLPQFVESLRQTPNLIPNCAPPNFAAVFGTDGAALQEADLKQLLCARQTDLPKLRMYCGLQDFLLQDNIRFQKLLQAEKLDCELLLDNGGHEWNFWDCSLAQALNWAKESGFCG